MNKCFHFWSGFWLRPACSILLFLEWAPFIEIVPNVFRVVPVFPPHLALQVMHQAVAAAFRNSAAEFLNPALLARL